MKGFGADATVTEEQYRQIQAAVVETARRTLIGRQIIGVAPPAGLGVQQFSFDKLTDVADADLAYKFKQSFDNVDLQRTNVNVPILQRDFKIEHRDLLSSRNSGTPLDISAARSAAYKVALLEDQLILKGHTNYSIEGLYDGAGNAEATSKDFATFGNPTDKIELAKTVLQADDIMGPYHLVLNPAQKIQLEASLSSTGVRELPTIEALLEGGMIFSSNTQTAATGMMLSAEGQSRGQFEYKLSSDFDTAIELIPLTKDGGLEGKVYVAGVPVIKDANAICTLTNI